tara:strand:- start:28 stop:519 length:492 start_codon:yes stop_codon:yes gene_type:complete
MIYNCYISIGTNLGNRIINCYTAISLLDEVMEIIAISSFYSSESWGYKDENDYINFVVKAQTKERVEDLLDQLKLFEILMGREKNNDKHYSARIIDFDILFFHNQVINRKNLIVPHPKLYNRKFVLEPLCELDPFFNCPLTKKTIKELLYESIDNTACDIYPH